MFVGRQHELAEIARSLADAGAGRGGFVLVSGEAGIGKTRLADAATERAAEGGFRVLWGRSWESAGAPPFWPWVQILRACLRELDDATLSACPAPTLSHVAELVPEIRQRLAVAAFAARSADSAEARFERFEAVSSFLTHAASERPLFLVLDDVHWADLPSLVLLEFFAQSLSGSPIVVVATYRDPQAGETPLDSGMLARLVRLGRHCALRGLSQSEVGLFVAEAGGAKPLASFVSALHEATNGNPFFVVEVLRLLAAEPAEKQLEQAVAEAFPIPQSVRATIRKRISLLPDQARSLLALGAVIGREFDVRVLERAGQWPAGEVLGVLGHAVEAGIVVPGRGAARSYAFSHGLVQETLYDDLAPAERAALHRRAGEAIEGVHAATLEQHLAELAHHFAEASALTGEARKAIEYSSRAGRRAAAMVANEEAIKHYDRALAFTTGPGDERQRCELLIDLGTALWIDGSNKARAAEVCREAVGIAGRLGDAELLGRAVLGLASPDAVGVLPGGGDPALIALFDKALMLLPPADGALTARLMARLGLELSQSEGRDRATRCASDAVAMARRVGDAFTLAQVLVWTYVATAGPDNYEHLWDEVDELRRAAEALDDNRFVFTAAIIRAALLIERGAMDDARREFRNAGERRQLLRSPFKRIELAELALVDAMLALLEGRLDEAERSDERALEIGAAWPQIAFSASIQLVLLRREQGRIEELAGAAEAMLVVSASPAPRAFVCWVLAEAGRFDEARRILTDASVHDFADFWRDSVWYWAIWLLSEAVTLLEDRARAQALFDLLSPFASRAAVAGHIWCGGSVARSVGNLAALLGRHDEAERHFETALAMNARMKARLCVAWTEYDYARMLSARGAAGDRERASALVERALATSRETGMVALERRAAPLRERIGLPVPARPEISFTWDGERWTIRYQAPAFQLRDGKGLRYLAHLLQHPGDELHVADLVAAVEGRAGEPRAALGDTGEVLDSRARGEYRERLAALEEELEEASVRHDAGHIERLSEEIEALKDALSAAYGLGGRSRRGGDVAERVRKAVTNRIRDAIAQIGRHDGALAEHLDSAVRTGKFCAYEPDLRGRHAGAIGPT